MRLVCPRARGGRAMIETRPTFERLGNFAARVCVIGGGPVGLATALALSRRGIRVLVLESGGLKSDPRAQVLADAVNATPETHRPPLLNTARRLGGASNLWGGRCVPLDPVDFEARSWLGLPGWPITDHDLEPHLGEAVAILDAGGASFREAVPGIEADGAVTFDTLERWSNAHRTHACHKAELETSADLLVALRATATGFGYDEGERITSVEVQLEGAGQGSVPVSAVVLAAGGNESTRLLLAEQRRRPRLFGGPDGPLGKSYMAHVNGQIADIAIDDAALRESFDYHVDAAGGYVRRRFAPSRATQARARLANIAFWPSVPRIHDARHRSGPLSAVFLALSIGPIGRRLIAEAIRSRHLGPEPLQRLPHVLNILRDPLSTLSFAPAFLWRSKIARMRLPGLFLRSPAGRYGLEYHGEHLPSAESRVKLSDTVDRTGLPRLEVALRFSEEDAASVVRAHAVLDDWLQRNALGRLDYHVAEDARAKAVLAEACHGAHQIGTARMGSDRASAVVDGDCVTFDVPNLAVVSTAVLPTSGQANPTLAAVQLGIRLADRLARGRIVLDGAMAEEQVAA